MSLTKQRPRTAKRIAASQANGKRSRGPATPEGRERIRDANLRHGFYSQDRDKALRALGENPKEFDAVVACVMEQWQPANGFEQRLVMRLARAMWRMERSDRMQEGYALRQAKDADIGRENRRLAQITRLKTTADSLRSLAQSVAHEHYVTIPADLELMKNMHQDGLVKETGETALSLFHQLQAPEGYDEDGRRIDPQAKIREVRNRIRGIFGLSPDPGPEARNRMLMEKIDEIYGITRQPETEAAQAPGSGQPQESQQDAGATQETQEAAGAAEAKESEPPFGLTSAEWEARERVRQLLKQILMRQTGLCEAQRKVLLKETLAVPSPFERAAEIAPTQPNATLMQRMDDSNFRQVARMTSLLLRIQRRAREKEIWKSSSQPQEVHENTPG